MKPTNNICGEERLPPSLIDHFVEPRQAESVRFKSKTFELCHAGFTLENERAVVEYSGGPSLQVGSGEKFFPLN
jgi:hypothetical protein